MGENCGVEESRRRKEVYESELRNCFIGAVEGNAEMMTMKFEVCDVKKALAAVWRIAVKGNRICFGPQNEDCYVQNVRDGRKMMMRRKGGSYVIDVVMNGESMEITVDSAAEESVCPNWFGEDFGIQRVEKGR